jgi:hypothetical protein
VPNFTVTAAESLAAYSQAANRDAQALSRSAVSSLDAWSEFARRIKYFPVAGAETLGRLSEVLSPKAKEALEVALRMARDL